MSLDRPLLKLLSNREYFNRFYGTVKKHVLSEESSWVMKQYDTYFNTITGTEEVDFNDLRSLILNGTSIEPSKWAIFDEVLTGIEEYDHAQVTDAVVKDYLRIELAENMAELSERILEGDDVSVDEYTELMEEFKHEAGELGDEGEEACPVDIHEVVNMMQDRGGYSWSMPRLNKHYGPACKGDLIHLFGFTNSGKTSFVVNETLHMMKQFKEGERLLWINNEEAIVKVALRYGTCGLDKNSKYLTKHATQADSDKMHELYGVRDRLIMKQVGSSADYKQVEALLDKYKPSVVVFNDTDKITNRGKTDNSSSHLSKVFTWARNVAINYNCLVLAVGQADVDSINKKKLYEDNLADCKVGKARESDLCIGIGFDEETPRKRYINLVKNKIGPSKIYFNAYFDGDTGRYVEEETVDYAAQSIDN